MQRSLSNLTTLSIEKSLFYPLPRSARLARIGIWDIPISPNLRGPAPGKKKRRGMPSHTFKGNLITFTTMMGPFFFFNQSLTIMGGRGMAYTLPLKPVQIKMGSNNYPMEFSLHNYCNNVKRWVEIFKRAIHHLMSLSHPKSLNTVVLNVIWVPTWVAYSP